MSELEHTVFVFRERATGKIKCTYFDHAKAHEKSSEFEHIATLNPAAWIQYHWDKVEGNDNATNP